MYVFYVIGICGIVRLCAVAIIVALVFKSEGYVYKYGILVYRICMAGSRKSAGISMTNLEYY
jgi:hypothetical protein